MKHIALLRAVNLGAHNQIGTADLKALLGLGFADAQTLLQSGNREKAGDRGTGRNWNTVLKLAALAG